MAGNKFKGILGYNKFFIISIRLPPV